jgi:addiction module RelE/StbE family toxin
MSIKFTKESLKQLETLPKVEKEKIVKALHGVEKEPLAGKKLTGQLKGLYTVRAWPYRIVYQVDQTKKQIIILRIAHRQGVYK